MGASPRTKSSYLNEINQKTQLLAWYQQNLANQKAWLSRTHTKNECKRQIELLKGDIARVKGEISVLKAQMKNAPKG